jgi:hypothetical protein
MSNRLSRLTRFAYYQDGIAYRKSSFSNTSCVSVGVVKDANGEVTGVKVGDTKNPSNQPHDYTVEEWKAFLASAKSGGFDI